MVPFILNKLPYLYSTDCRNCKLFDLYNDYTEAINNYYLKIKKSNIIFDEYLKNKRPT